jgi:hypothetical protein
MLNEPVEITLLVTTQLEALQTPYLVGGSVASIVYVNTVAPMTRMCWR